VVLRDLGSGEQRTIPRDRIEAELDARRETTATRGNA